MYQILTLSQKGHQILVDVPSIFSVPVSFASQTRSAPQKVKDLKIDSESRSLVTQKRLLQVDTISSWELLIELITVVSKNDSIILTVVAQIPPRMLFSLEVFKNS